MYVCIKVCMYVRALGAKVEKRKSFKESYQLYAKYKGKHTSMRGGEEVKGATGKA